MREKYQYLTKNVLIFAVSSFGTKFLSFLLVPFYTSVLTTAEYGIADIITTTATLMMYICTVNIADAVLRFAIERKTKQSEILVFGIRVLFVGSLVAILFLTITAQLHIADWPIMYYIFIFLYFWSTALYQIMSSYLRSLDKVMEVAVAGIISTAVMIAANIIFLLVIKIGIYGYLLSMVLGPLVASVYCIAKAEVRGREYVKNVCSTAVQKEMLRYCAPLIFNNIALWINAFLDKYFVTAICGVETNGIYAVASKIPTILATFYTVFSQAWTLSAIKEFDGEDSDGFFGQTYGIYNAAIAMACSFVILFNIPLAKILYAKDFFTAWNYSSVLLISIMFNALTAFLGSIFSAVKDSKVIASTTVASAVCNIVLNILLIPKFGALGAAIATAASYMVMWVLRLGYARKYIKMSVSIVKDCLAYGLLILQVVFEHTENHGYIGQIVIAFIIMFIYRKYIKTIVGVLFRKVKAKAGGAK